MHAWSIWCIEQTPFSVAIIHLARMTTCILAASGAPALSRRAISPPGKNFYLSVYAVIARFNSFIHSRRTERPPASRVPSRCPCERGRAGQPLTHVVVRGTGCEIGPVNPPRSSRDPTTGDWNKIPISSQIVQWHFLTLRRGWSRCPSSRTFIEFAVGLMTGDYGGKIHLFINHILTLRFLISFNRCRGSRCPVGNDK